MLITIIVGILAFIFGWVTYAIVAIGSRSDLEQEIIYWKNKIEKIKDTLIKEIKMNKRQDEIKEEIRDDIEKIKDTLENLEIMLKNKLSIKLSLNEEIKDIKDKIEMKNNKLLLSEAQLEDIDNNEKCLWIRVTEDQHNLGWDGICEDRIEYGNFEDFNYCPYCGRDLIIKHWKNDD